MDHAHGDNARATDQPIAGLLQDLKQRGLLEDTIVWFSGEFGRAPCDRSSWGARGACIIVAARFDGEMLAPSLAPLRSAPRWLAGAPLIFYN